MVEFIEFAGKKPYKCPKCKVEIRYAKFFGPDKKLLTTDGKEPNKIFGRGSNTGWPTDPNTKQMHECKVDNNDINNSQSIIPPRAQPELSDLDKKVRDKMIDDAYHDAEFMIYTLSGVELACNELGIELGPKSGMIFNQVCENIRRRNERGE